MAVAKRPAVVRHWSVNALLGLLLVLALFLSLLVGAVDIAPTRLLYALQELVTEPANTWSVDAVIAWRLRLPRALLAAAVGAALATAGAIMQGLLQNSLADSFVLGVSSGASLGAAIALLLGLRFTLFGLGAVTPLAFMGAMLAMLAVLIISRRVAGHSTLGLLLAGIAMNSALSAVVSFLVLLSRERINPLIFWMMGGFAGRGWNHFWLMLPYFLISFLFAYSYHRYLTAISLGDATAHHLGVDVGRVRLLLLATAALLTAAAVSVSGMIGFVGLMTPHFARMLVGQHYRRLLPTAAMCGAVFLTFADLLARVVMRPQELPVGIITALCGGPFFLWLLSRRRQEVA
ncbi:MAG: Hemin transport system permease protein HmuU [Firmicutes bacterium]|nr:Hemin transport system permease protein HmuU [candidate division NPL-UPA2 bacterium]MBT9154708.1 Hemin transport system permease protein HmuU [candidate division NPL-UPA2 bacterium]